MLPSPDHSGLGLRGHFLSRPPVDSLSLRPGDSLTIPRTALSVGFIRFVSSTNATQVTGFRLFPSGTHLPLNMPAFRWPHYGQGNYTNENFTNSVQTQVTGLNNGTTTVGFWADANGNNFGFYKQGNGNFVQVVNPNTG